MSGSPGDRHADEILVAVESGAAAKSALVASWRRSTKLHRLDPTNRRPPRQLSDSELHQGLARNDFLIRAARPSLDRLFQAVGGVGCCVVIADRNGVLLERRGASADDRTFRDWGLWTGTVWSEESEGTNGIGTCLVEQRALTIHRDQHFFTRNTILSCTTAPIFDHEGEIAAALDVSSCRADLTEDFVRLIAVAAGDAVRKIEAENFRLAYPNTRILFVPLADRSEAALIAVDSHDRVVGADRAARLSLGLTSKSLASVSAQEILGVGPSLNHLSEAERSVLERTLARVDWNVTEAARQLGISRATLHRKLNRFGIHRKT